MSSINKFLLPFITAALLTAVCIVITFWWFSVTPATEITLRADDSGQIIEQKEAAVDIMGSFMKHGGIPSSTITGSWPRFRGNDFNNVSAENVALAESWPESGPPLLWSINLGEGYAGPVVANGRVYLLDYDETEGADTLRCFSMDDGKEIWRRWYKVHIKRNHGMSRTVPAVSDRFIVTIGPKCQVLCADAISGDFIWGIDLASQFNTTVPLWYTGQCPLIDGQTAVIASGGNAIMIGVDCESGTILWETPNPDGFKMSHSSIILMTLCGKRMYVYCAGGGMVGISAEGDDLGKLLWSTKTWNHSVMAPAPVQLPDNRIFITAGYGVGSMILKVTNTDNAYTAEQVLALDRKVFACEQHTPILYKNHLFSVLPADAGALKAQAACMTADGKPVWYSGKEHRFGIGPFIIADNKMFILSDDGILTMIKADISQYTQLGQTRVLNGPDAWGPMAIVNGRLILRDLKKMICLDMRKVD